MSSVMRRVLWFHRPQFMYGPYSSIKVRASVVPPAPLCSALLISSAWLEHLFAGWFRVSAFTLIVSVFSKLIAGCFVLLCRRVVIENLWDNNAMIWPVVQSKIRFVVGGWMNRCRNDEARRAGLSRYLQGYHPKLDLFDVSSMQSCSIL